jgi:hypothetical protein
MRYVAYKTKAPAELGFSPILLFVSGGRQTTLLFRLTISPMKVPLSPHIAFADRLNDAIVVTFDDGKCAIYSASMLYALMPQARQITDSELEDETIDFEK